MNLWQLLHEIRAILRAAKWDDGTTPVFRESSVIVTTGPVQDVAFLQGAPLAFVVPGDTQADPQHRDEPGLVEQRIAVSIAVVFPGDRLGEKPLLGGNLVGGTNSSKNRGLLEIEERVLREIALLSTSSGVRIVFSSAGAGQPTQMADSYVVQRELYFTAWLGIERRFPGVVALSASVGGGNVTLTWRLPTSRFDLLKIVVRRAAGSTAPAAVTDGTGVTLASDLATSVVNAPGSGTWSYSVFAGYDENGVGTPNVYSNKVAVTVVV